MDFAGSKCYRPQTITVVICLILFIFLDNNHSIPRPFSTQSQMFFCFHEKPDYIRYGIHLKRMWNNSMGEYQRSTSYRPDTHVDTIRENGEENNKVSHSAFSRLFFHKFLKINRTGWGYIMGNMW